MSIEYVAGHIIALTDDDFEQAQAEALAQTNYHHPLKPDTNRSMRKLGQHNLKSIKMLKELQIQLNQAESMEVDLS